ncbi:hypothetical protein Tco_0401232 [Tanacetum coccineum]
MIIPLKQQNRRARNLQDLCSHNGIRGNRPLVRKVAHASHSDPCLSMQNMQQSRNKRKDQLCKSVLKSNNRLQEGEGLKDGYLLGSEG